MAERDHLTIGGSGRRRLADGPEAPEGPLLGSDTVGVCRFQSLAFAVWSWGLRPEGARPDPGLQVADLVRVQGILGRHLETRMGAPNRLDQQAGLRVTRKDGGTRLAALQDRFPGVQAEAALRRIGVAGKAVLSQKRADALLEEIGGILRCRQTLRPKHQGRGRCYCPLRFHDV